MELADDKGWIQITMNSYAEDEGCYPTCLDDLHNAVDVLLNFDCEDIGWGVVGDCYFRTQDIKELAQGLLNVFEERTDYFTYTAPYIYDKDMEGYTVTVFKKVQLYSVSLRIYDELDSYPAVTEIMNRDEFEKIVLEFQQAATQFPVR